MRENVLKGQTRSPERPVASRRRFLAGGASAAGGVLVASYPVAAVGQAPAQFRWQGAWAARDIFHEYALDYAKRVNDMSGGRLRIEVLPAGAVVKPRDLLEAVHKGVLDGCHAVPELWRGKSTAFSLFGAGPALGMDADNLLAWMEYGGGRALYDELQHRQLALEVVGFLYGPMPTQPLGWFRKPVSSPAQFKGLRFRAAGMAVELYRAMGANATELTAEEAVTALGDGRLDGAAFNNASSDLEPGLPEAARHCMLQSYHRTAEVFEILINRKKFDALAADLKAILKHAAEAASAGMSWKAIHRYSQDQARMREKEGRRFHRTPTSVLRAQMEAWQAVAARASRDNPFFARVLESQLAWARRTVGWRLDSVVDPRVAYDQWFGKQPAPGKGGKNGQLELP